MCFVLIGHKESALIHQEARLSWSPAEWFLISRLPNIVKQGYIACKCTFKSLLQVYRARMVAVDGRSHVCSFHIKTSLLHHLESTPPSKISSPFHLMMHLLHDLHGYISEGYMPHYFLRECNLLAMVGPDERHVALQAIQSIISDPVAAIINSPSSPPECYGDINPHDLISTIYCVSSNPSHERSLKDLLLLLSRLDQWRHQHNSATLEADERFGRSNRPELKGLVNMLKQMILL